MSGEQELDINNSFFSKTDKWKFWNFIKISPFSLLEKKQERKIFNSSIHKIIENQDWNSLALLFNNGLILNKAQENHLINIMDKEFFMIANDGLGGGITIFNSCFNFLNIMPQKGFVVPEAIINKFLCLSSSKDYYSIYNVIEHFNKADTDDFSSFIDNYSDIDFQTKHILSTKKNKLLKKFSLIKH